MWVEEGEVCAVEDCEDVEEAHDDVEEHCGVVRRRG